MQVSVQNGEGLMRRMIVELPEDEVQQEIERRLQELTRTARLNGFRPGKAPLKLVRSYYGPKIQNEVFEEFVSSSFQQAITQEKLQPIGTPVIDRLTPEDISLGGIGIVNPQFAYAAEFEVLPVVKLADMGNYVVYRSVVEVTELDVDAMLEHFRHQQANWSVVQRPAKLQDRVRASIYLTVPDATGVGQKQENLELILGAKEQEIENALIGSVAGERRTISTTMPNGMIEILNVEIHEVMEQHLPEVDAGFARSYGVESGDMAILRQDVHKNMVLQLQGQVRNDLKWQIMNVLLAAHPIPIPKKLMELERNTLIADIENQKGIMPAEEWINNQAMRRVALKLITGEIIRHNAIIVDPTRVYNTIQEIAKSYEDPDEVVRHYAAAEMRQSIEHLVLEDQVVDLVLSQVKVQDVQRTFDEVINPKEESSLRT